MAFKGPLGRGLILPLVLLLGHLGGSLASLEEVKKQIIACDCIKLKNDSLFISELEALNAQHRENS